MLLAGCLVGFGIGIVLATLLARPAGAATPVQQLESPASHSSEPNGTGPSAGGPVQELTGATDQLSPLLARPPPPVVPTVPVAPLGALAQAVPSVPTMSLSPGPIAGSPAAGSVPGPSGATASPTSSQQVSPDPQGLVTGHGARAPSFPRRAGAAEPSQGRPVQVPPLVPPAPALPPLAPAAALRTSSSTSSSSGSHLLEGLPPGALLLPALFGLVLALARRRAPAMLLDSRCARPG